MHGTRLKRHHKREHRHRKNAAANRVWNPEREDKRSYLKLDTDKLKLTTNKKGKKK